MQSKEASLHNQNIVVIGGGTGSFTLLHALKSKTSNITALVNMTDSGGSTGVLRDELGVLPPGDVRQCLVALSNVSEEVRGLFNFRFPNGTFEGHSFGNLFLSAVEKMTDNFGDAVRLASDLLQITGRVIPVTLDNCQLVLKQGNLEVVGEYAVIETHLSERPSLSLMPRGVINPEAKLAIQKADTIIIAPGNLYGSLIPALLVDGMAEALQQTEAKVMFVCNLVNKNNQTPDFGVNDYADELERFIGAGTLDYVLYNTDKPSPELLKKYALEDEYPVLINADKLQSATYKAVGGNFLSHASQTRDGADTRIKRSLIRHNASALIKAIDKL